MIADMRRGMHWAMSKVSSHTIFKQHMHIVYTIQQGYLVSFVHSESDSVAGPDPKNPHQVPCPDPDPDLNE